MRELLNTQKQMLVGIQDIDASTGETVAALDEQTAAIMRVADAQEDLALKSKSTAAAVDESSLSEDRAGKSSSKSSMAALGLVAAVAGIGYESIKSALNLNAASTQIAASGNVSLKTANTMTNAFLKMASGSEYSGLQVVQAFGPMAGVFQSASGHALSVHDSLMDMRAAMELATASGQPLTTVT